LNENSLPENKIKLDIMVEQEKIDIENFSDLKKNPKIFDFSKLENFTNQ